jgi:pantoate--beta-alanine ligase
MQIFTTRATLKNHLKSLNASSKIGFVPTMGALHEGHLSLVRNALNTADIVVVSIFVNPTQFDNKADLLKYPSTLQNDLYLLEKESCHVVFIPSVSELYENSVTSESFDFDGLELVMEGEHRAGHFDGVGTIVKRLFDIVEPDYAFFGEKDFQQLQIIKKMVEKEALSVKIIGHPIYRELDGLAMSSRNTRLTKEFREAAPFINKTLLEAKQLFGIKNAEYVVQWVETAFKKHPILELEYFTIADEATLLPLKSKKDSTRKYRGFIAVFAGDIRLIDNIAL